jgi:hypothetical protein
MRTLRAFFLTRLLREKLLLVAFVALGVLLWLSSFSKRAGRVVQAHRTITTELTQQQQWLANREAIESGAVQAVKNLDPARTLDDTRLVGDLSALARENKLRFTNDTPQTEQTGQFAIHTVQITLQRADLEDLRRFYRAITSRSPYMGVEQASLVADRANPNFINAALRVSSVEIIR